MTPDFVFLSLAHHLAQPRKDILAWMTPTFSFASLEAPPGWEAPFLALLDAYKKQGLIMEDSEGVWALTPQGQQLASGAIAVTTTTVTTTTSFILPQPTKTPLVRVTPHTVHAPTAPTPQQDLFVRPAPALDLFDGDGLPKPLFFRDSILRVMASMQNGVEGTPVKVKHVATEAIRLAGFDPADALLQKRLRWAIQNMQVDPNYLVRSAGYGMVTLTPKGLEESLAFNPPCPPPTEADGEPEAESAPTCEQVSEPPAEEPLDLVRTSIERIPQGNETAQWFAEHLKEPLREKMAHALRRKLPLSDQYNFIEDHIHNYVLQAIARNSLAKLIQQGPVPYYKVVAYCVNTGREDVRNSGTQPVMRELFNARTAKERAADRTHTVAVSNVVLATHEEGLLDIPCPSINAEDEVQRAHMWRKIRGAFGQDPSVEICCRVLRYKADGMSNKEIALIEDIPVGKAGAIFRHARKVLRRRVSVADLTL